jgi:secreted PhoX family phosphatase
MARQMARHVRPKARYWRAGCRLQSAPTHADQPGPRRWKAKIKGATATVIDYEGDKSVVYSNKGTGETFADILSRRLSRRGVLQGAVATSAVVIAGATTTGATLAQDGTPDAAASDGLTFSPITLDTGAEMKVAEGYTATPLLRWGDPLFPDSPAFDPFNQSAEAQALQVGYNCDWVGFLPLPGEDESDHGLLMVNHEYTNPEIMFPGYMVPNPAAATPEAATPVTAAGTATPVAEDVPAFIAQPSQAIVDTEIAAHGLSIVEVKRNEQGVWEVVLDSQYNRRITGTTPMEVTGPAAGTDLLQTSEDPTGTVVTGTLNNCAGGLTPWGTIVTGEENFNQYFANMGSLAEDSPVRQLHQRYGLPEGASERRWEDYHSRFDLAQEPNEPFRFGWGVEIDPFDPTSTPKKRTALGRNKHEGHTSFISPGGQVAIYSGDDERFDYAYKFVTAGTYNPDDRAANMDLLDEGTLYVAKFNDDGSGEWLPVIHGEGGLTEENGFASQADIVINTRGAGDILGATKMDRPEDFETDPVGKKVYLVLTNNTQRGTEGKTAADPMNPRDENKFGHIIEITEADDDAAATTFTWDIFMLCGLPDDASTYFAGFPREKVSGIACPDNITFDTLGNLWITTDGQPGTIQANDGVYAVPTAGTDRGYVRQFFSGVAGGEVSGPEFNRDNSALFVSIQHPGEGGRFEAQTSHWPDGGDAPPRPTVVVIQAATPGDPVGRA